MANEVQPWMKDAAKHIASELRKGVVTPSGLQSIGVPDDLIASMLARHAPVREAHAEHVRELVKVARKIQSTLRDEEEVDVSPVLQEDLDYALAHFEEGRDGK